MPTQALREERQTCCWFWDFSLSWQTGNGTEQPPEGALTKWSPQGHTLNYQLSPVMPLLVNFYTSNRIKLCACVLNVMCTMERGKVLNVLGDHLDCFRVGNSIFFSRAQMNTPYTLTFLMLELLYWRLWSGVGAVVRLTASLPRMHKVLGLLQPLHKLGLMVNACIPRPWAEAGGGEIEGHSQLHEKFKALLRIQWYPVSLFFLKP